MNIPDNLKYTKTHEWIKVEGDEGVIGITDYAQDKLGDIVFVELPEVGDEFSKDDDITTIESAKAVGELKAPVDCELTEVNSALEDAPEKINESPYEGGWIVKVKIKDASQLESLLDAAAYKEYLSTLDE